MLGQYGNETAIRRCSSGFPAPARRRCRPIPIAILIGDDEHGWSEHGIFNFEGGCYAKVIRLSKEAEPEIFGATQQFATVLENVVLDPGEPCGEFDDGSLTENTRAAYPLSYIPNASASGTGRASENNHHAHGRCVRRDAADRAADTGAGRCITFCRAIRQRSPAPKKAFEQPEATFSTCFGAPFMPRHPTEYGALLRRLISRHQVKCWLVNTGWTGGRYGVGQRMPIKVTRALLAAAARGQAGPGVDEEGPMVRLRSATVKRRGSTQSLLSPRDTWADKALMMHRPRKLVDLFAETFASFEAQVEMT